MSSPSPAHRSSAGRWSGQAADRGIPVQAEIGGLNPAIVLADADLERTASDLAYAAMGFAGQKCTATRRIICVGGVEAELVPLLIEKCRAMPVGDPADPGVGLGPVINDLAAENIRRVVNDAIQAGAEVLYLGQGYAEGGRLLGPALLSEVPRGTELEVDETFGPVVQIESVATISEAIDRANSSKYGLTGAVYRPDGRRMPPSGRFAGGGHGQDQRTHQRRHPLCALRRKPRKQLRAARTGQGRQGAVHEPSHRDLQFLLLDRTTSN